MAGLAAAAFLMAGAVRRHLVDGEGVQGFMPATVLAVLALFVAVGRIWVAPLGN